MIPSVYDETKYLISLCNQITDEITDEILSYFEYHSNENHQQTLSDRCVTFIQKNLSVHPVAVMQILRRLKESVYYNTAENEELLQRVIIEELMVMSESLDKVPTNSKRHIVDCALSVISEWDFTTYNDETIQRIISKIYTIKLIGNGKEFYLSILSQNTQQMMEALINYELKNVTKLTWPCNPDLMIEYCFVFNKHWLLECISNFMDILRNGTDLPIISDKVTQKLWQLTLINYINSPNKTWNVTFDRLKSFFSLIDYQNCEENLFVYFNEMYRELNLLSFCINNSKKKNHFEWCDVIKNQSALLTISKMCDLSKLERFKVKQALNMNTELLLKTKEGKIKYEQCKNWDILTYNAYCILTTIIDTIIAETNAKNTGYTQNDMDEIKLMISNLKPVNFRIEVLKNIFACIFVRYEYFVNEENRKGSKSATHSDCSYFIQNSKKTKFSTDRQGFMCTSKLVKDILKLLKSCLDMLHDDLKINCDKENLSGADVEDLATLTTHVSHALWKWDIITNMKVENWEFVSTSSLYNSLIDLSSDEERSCSQRVRERKKIKHKKRRSKSYNECLFLLSKNKNANDLRHKNIFTEPDFVSLMLSSPDTMIALSLDSNDYQKAYKIIESYDYPDSNAYSEISFSERFSAITTNIKNNALFFQDFSGNSLSASSVALMSILEGFLSQCHSPYNYQLSELVQAFPQLQVYENTKSPIVVVIDLLISTGINRNITLGILNVAENKYQEIDASRKVNSDCNNFIDFLRNNIGILYDIYEDDTTNSKNKGICDILINDKLPMKYLDFSDLKKNLRIVDNLYPKLKEYNPVSISDCQTLTDTVLKLRKLLTSGAVDHNISCNNKYTSYLKCFFEYIENISNLQNLGEDINVSEIDTKILKTDVHDIVGYLIHDKKKSLDEIEPICRVLGINMIHKVVLNYCTSIKCTPTEQEHSNLDIFYDLFEITDDEKVDPEMIEIYDNVTTNKLNQDTINYILLHNWVIANLLKKIHSDPSEHALQQSLDDRTKYLDAFLNEERFEILKVMYGNNRPVTALQTDYDISKLHTYLKNLLLKDKYVESLEVLNTLPERMLFRKIISSLKDHILLKLSATANHGWKYFKMIKSAELRAGHIFEYVTLWSYEGATEVLQQYVNQFSPLSDKQRNEGKKWLSNLPIYEKISLVLNKSSWTELCHVSSKGIENIFENLMVIHEYDLCLQWSILHNISENVKNLIINNTLKHALQNSIPMPTTKFYSLLTEIPRDDAVDICKAGLHKMRDLEAMKIVLKLLLQKSENPSEFDNDWIGMQFLLEMEPNERPLFWDLFQKPLLIIEQYLMNSKFEKLAKLLKKIKPFLKVDPTGDNIYYNVSLVNNAVISVNAVDALLRLYAAKALDLKSGRVSKTPSIIKPNDEIFLQSIDSINLVGSPTPFAMPDEAPTKESWVPDNYSNCCMMCTKTIFSILIRRHHCRRCGRLVCYACSRHRILIENMYGDIKVRACDFCYVQTKKKMNINGNDKVTTQTGSSSIKSDSPSMEWCLTANPKHDDEIRKEFVYDFSPSVNICLTIMKMHSINLDYPRFLLDRCSELSRLVGNVDDGVLELMRMRRALLLSCTVLYSRHLPLATTSMMETALAHTERQLIVTDVMTHVATHGCQNIMPEEDSFDSNKPHLNIRLVLKRDQYIRQLLKTEKWELALEISTKFGLPKTGVLAAWGKACLKAGCFNMARQKFALCFKNMPSMSASISIGDSIDALKGSPSDRRLSNQLKRSDMNTSSTQLEVHRTKNAPALLDEIISLLEGNSYPATLNNIKRVQTFKSSFESLSSIASVAKKIGSTEVAVNINHALNSAHNIKNGDFSDFTTTHRYVKKSKGLLMKKHEIEKYEFKQKLEPFFYDECLYYLMSYGSPSSIINFYLKYGDTVEALHYCYNQYVDKEIFTENIFFKYLRKNSLDDLLKIMYEIDSTWNVWTEYLMYACRVLEKRGLFEALLSVQTGVGDHVRAAMTCVGLYKKQTDHPHIAALHTRSHYLAQAKGHLQHMPRKSSIVGDGTVKSSKKTLHLKLDTMSLDVHMMTINRQIDVITYLYTCEMCGRLTEKIVGEVLNFTPKVTKATDGETCIPTLFGTKTQKIQAAVLLMACSKEAVDGFGLANKIIKEHSLDAFAVFNCTSRYLIHKDRFNELLKLCDVIKAHYEDNNNISDSLIESSVVAIVQRCDTKGRLFDELAELLILKVDNVSVKISCYIECRILKIAYQLAIDHDKTIELKRIMKEAERLGQTSIKNACMKKLTSSNNNVATKKKVM